MMRAIGQQFAAYLPFNLVRWRAAAFPSGECVLRALNGLMIFSWATAGF